MDGAGERSDRNRLHRPIQDYRADHLEYRRQQPHRDDAKYRLPRASDFLRYSGDCIGEQRCRATVIHCYGCHSLIIWAGNQYHLEFSAIRKLRARFRRDRPQRARQSSDRDDSIRLLDVSDHTANILVDGDVREYRSVGAIYANTGHRRHMVRLGRRYRRQRCHSLLDVVHRHLTDRWTPAIDQGHATPKGRRLSRPAARRPRRPRPVLRGSASPAPTNNDRIPR